VRSVVGRPLLSYWPMTVASDQPPEARAMTTAMRSPPSSWPRRVPKRAGIVEVAAAFGLPLPALGAVAVAALAGPLDLGGGPLQGRADLIGLDLGH
jgi:hypothetical protein